LSSSIQEHPAIKYNRLKTITFLPFSIQRGTIKADFGWGYFRGYFPFYPWGYFPLAIRWGLAVTLTDTGIRKAKAKNTAYRMSDGGGLYLFVTPPGGKLWRWKYRFEGREKLMSFGGYPDVSPSLARERHLEARKLLVSRAE
jgi:hypothetical protein